MSDTDDTRADSAEKAYAAAAEAVSDKPAPADASPEQTTPAVAAATAPTAAVTPAAIAQPAAKIATPAASAPTGSAPATSSPALAKPRKTAAKAPKAEPKPAVARKPAAPRTAAKPKAAPARAKAPAKSPAVKAAAIKAPARPKVSIPPKPPVAAKLKEKTMATKTSEFTEGFQKIAADTQDKAKKAFEKSTALFGEYGEFAKGNVEAVVESSKILAAGMQEIGTGFVAESRTALETATADIKDLAAIKSPTDFLKFQSDILRRNVDSAVAYSTKNSEAMLKLATDAFKPISGRFSLALEKVRKAA